VIASKTGIGMKLAAAATERMLDAADVDLVLVVGIAGGVGSRVHVQDLIIPEVVVDGASGTEYRPAPLTGVPEPHGRLVSSDDFLVEPDEIKAMEDAGV